MERLQGVPTAGDTILFVNIARRKQRVREKGTFNHQSLVQKALSSYETYIRPKYIELLESQLESMQSILQSSGILLHNIQQNSTLNQTISRDAMSEDNGEIIEKRTRGVSKPPFGRFENTLSQANSDSSTRSTRSSMTDFEDLMRVEDLMQQDNLTREEDLVPITVESNSEEKHGFLLHIVRSAMRDCGCTDPSTRETAIAKCTKAR